MQLRQAGTWTIRGHLLLGLIGGALGCVLAAGALLYALADHEADEQSDQRLRQLAWSLPLQSPVAWRLPYEHDPDERYDVQVWDAHGRPVHVSPSAPVLPLTQPRGYAMLLFRGQRWRVYTDQVDGYHVQVSQPMAVRQRQAAQMALRITPPLLLLLPAMALLIWMVVGRAMQPLEWLTRALGGRSPAALQALDASGLPPDLHPIVMALNGLLSKVEDAIVCQRNFVADAAHELRSPLTALKLQLQLAERAADDQARQSAFRKLHERLDRATHLVQQLMTLARQEQQAGAAPRVECDLLNVARQVVADHALFARSRGVALNLIACGAAPLQAHPDSLAAMAANLIDNAVRYTPGGGKVEVTVGADAGAPYLRVADNGPGVPAASRERLLDRFYRPEGNEQWGSGLGLAIVKSAADAHQASLQLDANAGGGLVVSVRFTESLMRRS
jgi:two-component system OmpR family sensor kinase